LRGLALFLAVMGFLAPPAIAAEPESGPESTPPPAADPDPDGAGMLTIAPSGGIMGEQPFFALRVDYAIAHPIAIEAELGHNVGEVTSAYLHSAGVRVTGFRWHRASAFLTAGFGTFSAANNDAIAAKSVTRSHVRLGGGVEYRVRDDFGFRLDLRHHRVLLGGSEDGSGGSLGVNEVSFGIAFSRRIWTPPSSGSVTP
jgi:hypothetical protein